MRVFINGFGRIGRSVLRAWLGAIALRKVIIDPSAASMIAQLKRDGWRSVTPADNDVVPGIGTVAMMLECGRLKVHRKNCPNLIKELIALPPSTCKEAIVYKSHWFAKMGRVIPPPKSK